MTENETLPEEKATQEKQQAGSKKKREKDEMKERKQIRGNVGAREKTPFFRAS